MLLPVACIDGCVLNRIATVDHHSVADIDADMRSTGRIIGALKEDQITGSCAFRGNTDTGLSQSLRSETSEIPSDTAVIDHPADKAGAVKGG